MPTRKHYAASAGVFTDHRACGANFILIFQVNGLFLVIFAAIFSTEFVEYAGTCMGLCPEKQILRVIELLIAYLTFLVQLF